MNTNIGIKNKSHASKYARQLWLNMLKRVRLHHNYKECTISDNFKDYKYFEEWCYSQIGFGVIGYDLDKDLLSKGIAIYSETTCVFVPKGINLFLRKVSACRGTLPIGVYYDKQYCSYRAQCRIDGVNKNLGRYSTPEQAFNAYKTAKEQHAKVLAERYKGMVSCAVVSALQNYAVNMDD